MAASRAVGAEAEFRVGRSYRGLARDDLAFVCGLAFVAIGDGFTAIAAPVPSGRRYGGEPVYFSDVVVRRDSTHRSFDDLRGAAFAYNEPLSQSGIGTVRDHLARKGLDWSFFGRLVRTGSHDRSIRAVAAGDADAAAIDAPMWECAVRDRPELGQALRVVAALGPSAVQPLVASRRLDDALVQEIRDAVTSFAGEPVRAAAIDRFVAVDDSHYAALWEAHHRATLELPGQARPPARSVR